MYAARLSTSRGGAALLKDLLTRGCGIPDWRGARVRNRLQKFVVQTRENYSQGCFDLPTLLLV